MFAFPFAEIKSLFGQPDYRSVNLTWEVEEKADKQLPAKDDVRSFIVHFCELQSWGEKHRCRSKVLEDVVKQNKKLVEIFLLKKISHLLSFYPLRKFPKIYKMSINNLRMATKYTFMVRPQKHRESEKSARSENFSDEDASEQSIIIPTKGFSAVATKCLPNESEILIETGPNFGGKIASENGKCAIDGNTEDGRDSYTMRIDHEKCGSQVSHDDLTVETYITVQENSGLLTHSTRRFLVICTFQPETLMVRARLALPSKGGASAIADDSWPEQGRGARERQFNMVDKSSLILKESSEQSMENAIGDIENLTEKILREEPAHVSLNTIDTRKHVEPLKNARYSRHSSEAHSAPDFLRIDSLIGITIGVALIVLIAFIFLYVLKKDPKNPEHLEKLQATAVF